MSRSALITGRSAGIGLAIAAMLLVEDDWDITRVARDPGKLGEAMAQLKGNGAKVHTIAANLANEVADQVVADHLQFHGRLDLRVSNASVGPVGPMGEKSAKALDLEISLNLRSAYRLMQASLAALRASARIAGPATPEHEEPVTNPAQTAGHSRRLRRSAWVSQSLLRHLMSPVVEVRGAPAPSLETT
jgi:NAD(P)-dependent dehydrogenase (short-subunit alcohol dehydrogenase family)